MPKCQFTDVHFTEAVWRRGTSRASPIRAGVEGAPVGGGSWERLLIFFPMHGIFAQACRTEVMSIDGPHRLAVSPLAPEFAKPLEHEKLARRLLT